MPNNFYPYVLGGVSEEQQDDLLNPYLTPPAYQQALQDYLQPRSTPHSAVAATLALLAGQRSAQTEMLRGRLAQQAQRQQAIATQMQQTDALARQAQQGIAQARRQREAQDRLNQQELQERLRQEQRERQDFIDRLNQFHQQRQRHNVLSQALPRLIASDNEDERRQTIARVAAVAPELATPLMQQFVPPSQNKPLREILELGSMMGLYDREEMEGFLQSAPSEMLNRRYSPSEMGWVMRYPIQKKLEDVKSAARAEIQRANLDAKDKDRALRMLQFTMTFFDRMMDRDADLAQQADDAIRTVAQYFQPAQRDEALRWMLQSLNNASSGSPRSSMVVSFLQRAAQNAGFDLTGLPLQLPPVFTTPPPVPDDQRMAAQRAMNQANNATRLLLGQMRQQGNFDDNRVREWEATLDSLHKSAQEQINQQRLAADVARDKAQLELGLARMQASAQEKAALREQQARQFAFQRAQSFVNALISSKSAVIKENADDPLASVQQYINSLAEHIYQMMKPAPVPAPPPAPSVTPTSLPFTPSPVPGYSEVVMGAAGGATPTQGYARRSVAPQGYAQPAPFPSPSPSPSQTPPSAAFRPVDPFMAAFFPHMRSLHKEMGLIDIHLPKDKALRDRLLTPMRSQGLSLPVYDTDGTRRQGAILFAPGDTLIEVMMNYLSENMGARSTRAIASILTNQLGVPAAEANKVAVEVLNRFKFWMGRSNQRLMPFTDPISTARSKTSIWVTAEERAWFEARQQQIKQQKAAQSRMTAPPKTPGALSFAQPQPKPKELSGLGKYTTTTSPQKVDKISESMPDPFADF